jgi:hypothetical protein
VSLLTVSRPFNESLASASRIGRLSPASLIGAYRIFRGGQKAARAGERGKRLTMLGFIDLSHDVADSMPGFTTDLARGAASMPIRAFAEVT